MKNKILLIVSERCIGAYGGAELATHAILHTLKPYFDIVILSGCSDPPKLGGVKYFYEPLLSKWVKPFVWVNTWRAIRRGEIIKLIEKADIIYIPRYAFPVIPLAKSLGKKVVVHLHDYIPVSWNAAVLAPYEEHRERLVGDVIGIECRRGAAKCLASLLFAEWALKMVVNWLRESDSILCVSERHAHIVGELAPDLRDRITVIYNPLPPHIESANHSKALDNTPTFIYAGGDEYVKGFDVLVEAIKYIKPLKALSKIVFLLANRYREENLRRLWKALKGASKNYIEIRVLGRLPYEDYLLNVHSKVWALIFPSVVEEPLPYAVYESMALGTIPIAARVGGVPELLEGTIAERLMFKPRSSIELSSHIEEVASMDPNDLVELGKKLSYRARSLSEIARKKLIEHFMHISEGRPYDRCFYGG